MHFDTPDNIINSAGKELGLWTTTVSNPFSSTDDNCLMLVALLNRVGRMLVKARPWSWLTREYTFATVNGTASYALPTGFDRIRDQTHWNRTTALPLGGPASAQAWQMMKARTATGTVVRPFRVFGNLLYLYPTPTAAENVYYEFITSYWVRPTAQTVPTATSTTLITDTLWFDETLMVAGLKLAFARAKGRDATGPQAEYDECYRAAAGGDSTAPIVSAVPSAAAMLLGAGNIPDTGMGS